jgi:hypothetical protein
MPKLDCVRNLGRLHRNVIELVLNKEENLIWQLEIEIVSKIAGSSCEKNKAENTQFQAYFTGISLLSLPHLMLSFFR